MYGLLSILFFVLGINLRDDKIVQVLLFAVSGLFSIATCLSVIEDKLTKFFNTLINNKIIVTIKDKEKDDSQKKQGL